MDPVTSAEDDGNAISLAWQEFSRTLIWPSGWTSEAPSPWARPGPAEPKTSATQDRPGGMLRMQPAQHWVGRGLACLFPPRRDARKSRPEGDRPRGLPLVVQTRETQSGGRCHNSECQVQRALPPNGRLCKVLFTKSVRNSFRAHGEGAAEITPHPLPSQRPLSLQTL